jgi:putative addiction module killer protein
MIEVRQTTQFRSWFDRLRDDRAKDRITVRIRRLSLGNFGDAKYFDGIGEMRIDYGPGYRIYFVQRGAEVIVLLAGGDKQSQRRDIANALKIAKEV